MARYLLDNGREVEVLVIRYPVPAQTATSGPLPGSTMRPAREVIGQTAADTYYDYVLYEPCEVR